MNTAPLLLNWMLVRIF